MSPDRLRGQNLGDKLKATKARVLEENTAQAIFKHLDRLKDSRKTLGPRWIWELLQNARDAAPEGGVEVEILQSKETLRFRHNGQPFSAENITHLIYHGSTKLDEKDSVGHFGSGFISTHLLSPLVTVRGPLEDGQHFDFQLDRRGATVEELRTAINQSWELFEESLSETDSSKSVATEFEYALDDVAREICTAGLKELEKCAPLVLAFGPEISKITVKTMEEEWIVARTGVSPLTPAGNLLRITSRKESGSQQIFIALVSDGELQVAVPLRETDTGFAIELDEHAPRVYILFPLLGTNRLMLPAAVNSKVLKPLEDRNGLHLRDEEEGPKQNQAILQAAVPLMIQLMEAAMHGKWAGTHQLLAFRGSSLPEWVDSAWFCTLAVALLRRALDLPLIPALGGEWITPRNAWIPSAKDAHQLSSLWELSSKLSISASKLPRREEMLFWSRNLSNWIGFLTPKSQTPPEALTIDVLAKLVSDSATIDGLRARLIPEQDPFDWLGAFLSLVLKDGRTKLLDDLCLLPSQSGHLRKRSELLADGGIDEGLKDIARALGRDSRTSLLDRRIVIGGIVALLTSAQEADALEKTVERLKAKIQNGRIPEPFIAADAALFWWIVERRVYQDKLNGFPIVTEHRDQQGALVFYLARDAAMERMPLAPITVWPEAASRYASLFPRQKVIDAAFADERHNRAQWESPGLRGYIHLSPIFEGEKRMGVFLPSEPLPDVAGNKEHGATQGKNVSEIAFLNEKDVGLIDTARKSTRTALQLIRFLVEFVIEADQRAFERVPVPCECGALHDIYRASWLVPLRKRSWLPLELDGALRSLPASAESIAGLLRDEPELVKRLATSRGRSLLLALGINPADFTLHVIAKDEASRASLIQSISELASACGDVAQVRQLAEDLRQNPTIIDLIKTAVSERQQVQRNQMIGKLVEDLLREEMRAQQLTVDRTGVGSDFEVKSRIDAADSEGLLNLELDGSSILLEVKATRTEYAKMTPRQVQTACSEGARFALCVVALTDDSPTRETVRERSRFVFDIGTQLQPVWDTFKQIRSAEGLARQHTGSVVLTIDQGEPRFLVGQEIFSKGLPLGEAVTEFKRRFLPRQ